MLNPIPRRKHRRNRGPVDTMRLDAQRRQAFDMALEHVPVPEIAKKFQVTAQTVYGWLNHEHEKVLAGISLDAKKIRDRQNHDIEKLLQKWLPMALSDRLDIEFTKGRKTIQLAAWEGPVKASEIVLKLLQQQAKINGLDTLKVDLKSGGLTLPDAFVQTVQGLVQGLAPVKIAEAQVVTRELENNGQQ